MVVSQEIKLETQPKKQYFSNLEKSQKSALGLLSIGTFLEYFDLMIYVHMAVVLNELFFPKTDPFTASLLAAFAFTSTYLLRPFGAIIFGWIGDNIGRKHTVVITTTMMAISCVVMANLPTYAEIGIAAAWVITICRMVQGLSSMGEIIGAELYMTEVTKPPVQYFAVGIITVFSSIGSMCALVVSWYSTSYGFNWRLVFWIGAVVAIVGSTARMILRETPDFVNAKKRLKEFSKDSAIYKEKVNVKAALSLFFMQCAWPVSFYFIYIYCSQALKTNFGMSGEEVIQHNLILSIIQVVSFIFFTISSYWIYPLDLLRFKLIGFASTVILFLIFGYNSSYQVFSAFQYVFTFFILSYSSAMPICYKHFPVFKRFTYATMLYAISRAVIYVVISFGLVYLTKYAGHMSILLIILPIVGACLYATKCFESLDIEAGNYKKT